MGGHEGHEEEGSHEACHEGSSSSSPNEGHEGHEEEGSHEARHEGSSSSGSNEGHEGHEEEGCHEALCHEGSSSSGSNEGHEGNESNEVNMMSGWFSRDAPAFETSHSEFIGCVVHR